MIHPPVFGYFKIEPFSPDRSIKEPLRTEEPKTVDEALQLLREAADRFGLFHREDSENLPES